MVTLWNLRPSLESPLMEQYKTHPVSIFLWASVLVDDVDEDNDEKAPPGGSKMKAQGPGLKLMEF